MITDQKTPVLGLPLPHSENELVDDVERIRLSLAKLDMDAGDQHQKVATAQKTADEAVTACGAAQRAADKGIADAGAAQLTANKGVADAAGAQATADTALAVAADAIEKSTKVASPPLLTVGAQSAIGYPSDVTLMDGPIKLCETVQYLVSLNGGEASPVTGSGGRASYTFTPIGNVGDTVSLTAITVDALGNKSAVGTASTELVNVSIAPPSILSPVLNEAEVSLIPTISVSAMAMIGGVEDTAKYIRVQIATDAEFVGIVFDTGESYTASTSVPVTVELERNRQHFVRAKYTGNAFNAGNWCAPHPFTTQSANVVRVCQPTEGVAGRTWQRIDLACNVVQGNPNFNAHPTYAGIVEQLIDNQYMVGFPKCFVSREVLATGQYVGKDCRSLSDVALPGYDVHPAFLAKDGTTAQDMIWLGKYQACDDGSSKAGSKPAVSPLVSIDFTTMQTRCTARNTSGVSGFHLWNIHELSLVQLMMVLEFAGTDMQELVGRGHVDNTPSGVQTVDHANVLQASWRGLTGIWGNIGQMVDGIRGGKNTNKFRLDMGKGFVDTTITTCNTALNPDKMLNISGTGWSTKHLFVGDPDTKAASLEVAAYPDTQWHYANSTSYEYIAYAGGYYDNASAAGLFYLYMNYSPTNYYSSLGGRLAKW